MLIIKLPRPLLNKGIFKEREEWRVIKATTYHRLTELRFGATPDFWLNDDGLLQAKIVNPHEWERWQGRPPLGYLLQTLAELIVTQRAWGVLALAGMRGGVGIAAMSFDWLFGLQNTSLGLPNPLNAQAQADQAYYYAAIAQQNYDNSKQAEEYRRRAYFATLSKGWLNAMLDVELGT
jgi:hypothetical protein